MTIDFSEFSKIASKVVDELPAALDQLDVWISQVEANPTELVAASVQLKSAETLRDGLASILASVEGGVIVNSAEMDPTRLISTLEGASDSLKSLADAVKDIPSVEDSGQLLTIEQVAGFADLFAASVE